MVLRGVLFMLLLALAGAFCYVRLMPLSSTIDAFTALMLCYMLAGGIVESTKLMRRYY
jgi:hypothetical protein